MTIEELRQMMVDAATEGHEIEVYDPIAKDFVEISALAWDDSRVRLLGAGLEQEFEKQEIEVLDMLIDDDDTGVRH